MDDLLAIEQCAGASCDELCNSADFGCSAVWTERDVLDCYCAGCNGCPATGGWMWIDFAKAALLLLQLLALAWHWRGVGRRARSLCRAAASRCGATLCRRRLRDPHESKEDQWARLRVAALMQKSRSEALLRYALLTSGILGFVSLDQLSRRWSAARFDYMSDGQHLCVVAVLSLALVMALWPREFTRASCMALASSMYLPLVLIMSSPLAKACRDGYLNTLPSFVLMLRIPLSLFVLELPLALFWNLAYCVVVVHTVRDNLEYCYVELNGRESYEIATFIFSTALMVVMDHQFKQKVQQEVRTESTQTLLHACRSLLATMCDAVVELDTSFCISNPSDSLAMLILSFNGRSLVGKDFRGMLFSEGDRETFARSMQRSAGEVGGPLSQAFHVQLRSSQGDKISAELFHVSFVSLGKVCHLVGVAEKSDGLAAPRIPESTHTQTATRNAMMGLLDSLPEGMPSGYSDVADSPSQTSACSSLSETPQSTEAYPTSVWFNVSSPDTYPVVGSTVSFRRAMGSPGTEEGLLQWVHPLQRDAFVSFVQKSYFQLANPRLEDPTVRFPEAVKLRLSRMRRLGCSVEASVELSMLPMPESAKMVECSSPVACLTLGDLRWQSVLDGPGSAGRGGRSRRTASLGRRRRSRSADGSVGGLTASTPPATDSNVSGELYLPPAPAGDARQEAEEPPYPHTESL